MPPRTALGQAAIDMPKPARRALLRRRGWTRIGGYGAESWRSPDRADRASYTLAAATRAQLEREGEAS